MNDEMSRQYKSKVGSPVDAFLSKKEHLIDIIAPNTIEEEFDYLIINGKYYRTLYVSGYPRFVSPGWLDPVVNFDSSLDIAFYIYPIDAKTILDDLRRKITEMEAEIETDIERGRIAHATTEAKLDDAKALQEELVKGIERFFEFAFYITIPAATIDELNDVSKQILSTLGALLINGRTAALDQENGFL